MVIVNCYTYQDIPDHIRGITDISKIAKLSANDRAVIYSVLNDDELCLVRDGKVYKEVGQEKITTEDLLDFLNLQIRGQIYRIDTERLISLLQARSMLMDQHNLQMELTKAQKELEALKERLKNPPSTIRPPHSVTW